MSAFEEAFGGPALLAKQLELRWFHPQTSCASFPLPHRMPFLRRCLSYVAVHVTKEDLTHDDQATSTQISKPSSGAKLGGARTKASAAVAARPAKDVVTNLLPTRQSKRIAEKKTSRKRLRHKSIAVEKISDPTALNNDAHVVSSRRSQSVLDLFTPKVNEKNDKNRTQKLKVDVKKISGQDTVDNDPHTQQNGVLSTEVTKSSTKPEDTDCNGNLHVNSKNGVHQSDLSRTIQEKQKLNHSSAIFDMSLNAVFFYYGYHDKEASPYPVAQTECRTDRRCPLCSFNAVTDAGVVLHCRSCHSGLSFDCGIDEDQQLHIAVKPSRCESNLLSSVNEKYDSFVFFANPKWREARRLKLQVPFIQRPHHLAAIIDSHKRRKKVIQLEQLNAPASVIRRLIRNDHIPVRQYFHSRTNLPMLNNEWDHDSDEDADEEWILKWNEEMLEEFDDVSPQEKDFMTLWNRFILLPYSIADHSIPSRCLIFVRKFFEELDAKRLRPNFLYHLLNLWDSLLLSSSHVAHCMAEFDNLVSEKQNLKDSDLSTSVKCSPPSKNGFHNMDPPTSPKVFDQNNIVKDIVSPNAPKRRKKSDAGTAPVRTNGLRRPTKEH